LRKLVFFLFITLFLVVILFPKQKTLKDRPAELSLQSTETIEFLAQGQLNDSVAFQLAEQVSNVAATFWEHWNHIVDRTKLKPGVLYCTTVQLTDIFSLKHSNIYWQLFETTTEETSMTMHLFNAYYDNRPILNDSVVRIITSHKFGTRGAEREWW